MLHEILLLLVSGIILHFLISRLREPSGMPPGPRPLPLVGNLIDIIRFVPYVHEAFCKLRSSYGDIFTIYLQGRRTVVINSAAIAREALLEKKDDFAGRPFVFTGDYVTRHSKDIVFGDYSERLKMLKKIASKALRLFNPQLEAVVHSETDDLVKRMKVYGSKATDIKNDIQLSIMNVICNMIFGERYSMDDPEFLNCVYFTDTACRVAELTSPLGLFPWLIHFPIQATGDINKCCKVKDEILNRKYREHIVTLDEHKTRDLTDALLKVKLDEERLDMKADVIEEDHVIMTMQDVFIAGNETSTTTILWTLVYLITHPKIQDKIHAQLDEVVGFDRKPKLTDRENLPFVEAVLAETSRLSSVVPLSIPHKSIKDTSLQGYLIPKDTLVIVNLWAIHHDEKEWENPMEFRPERFLDSEGKLVKDTNKLSYMPFSAGRRMCLGEALARQEMFLIICELLQHFQFKAPNEPFKEPAGKDGIVRAPHAFEVCLMKRTGAQ